MSYVAYPTSPNTQYDKESFDSPPTVPVTVGDITAFENGLNSLPITGMVTSFDKAYLRNTQPGNFLSQDQIKMSYPLIADKYPKGGVESDIKFDNARKEREIGQDTLLEHMKPGFISSVSRLAATNLSMAVDPIGLLTGSVAEKVGGVIGSKVIGSLMKSDLSTQATQYASLAAKSGIGFAKGVATGLPFALASKDYYQSLNMTYSPLNTAMTLGMFGFGDALLTTVVGFKSPIMPEDSQFLAQKAMQDIANNKYPDVELSLKQALYRNQQIDLDDNIEPEDQNRVIQALNNVHNDARKEQSDAKSKLEDFVKDRPDLQNALENPIANGKQIIDKANLLKGVQSEYYSPEEESFMNRLPNNSETKEAINYAMMDPKDLNEDQASFLQKFQDGREKDLIQEGIENNQKQIDNLNAQLPKMDEAESVFAQTKLNALKDELDRQNTRLNDLENLDKLPDEFNKLKDDLEEKTKIANRHQRMLEDTDLYFRLRNLHDNGATQEELANSVSYNRSPQSNTDYAGNEPGVDIQNEPISDDEANAIEEEINTHINANREGSDEFRNAMEDLGKDQRMNDRVNDALEDYKNCIIERE